MANVASIRARPVRADRGEVDLRRLVAGFLRMARDVAIVGELRDSEIGQVSVKMQSWVPIVDVISLNGETPNCTWTRRPAAAPEGSAGCSAA